MAQRSVGALSGRVFSFAARLAGVGCCVLGLGRVIVCAPDGGFVVV